ncbi:MAG TPA: TlpA family protein disulfide reductase [Gammaproteobacteria bacterium]|nr:TlpA family protein disulfide reductase [Gammaproteobacteria bacterium]|tara:strand:+ start:2407 stop:2931 length:525 start_codon:yes stop_codon:yes gene_type:complete
MQARPRAPVLALLTLAALAAGLLAAQLLRTPAVTKPATAHTLVAFELDTSDGERWSSGSLAGKAALVNFWATWCEPCRTEIPLLMTAHTLHASTLAVVGIAVDDPAAVRRFEDESGFDYTSLIGKSEGMDLMAQYGNTGQLPFTLFFDASGQLRQQKTGALASAELDAWLKALL